MTEDSSGGESFVQVNERLRSVELVTLEISPELSDTVVVSALRSAIDCRSPLVPSKRKIWRPARVKAQLFEVLSKLRLACAREGAT